MARIRVLVTDDSAIIRKIVSETLKEDPEIEVVGTAPNGKLAVDKIERLEPHVMTLDIEMPVLDGLGTLKEIKARRLNVAVVMVSSLTSAGAMTTLDALSLGAKDYVTKPTGGGSLDEAKKTLRAQLLPKVKALGARFVRRSGPAAPSGSRPSALTSSTPTPAAPARERAPRALSQLRPGRYQVVTIGISTGGPNALAELIPALPGDLGVPIVLVQHMPPLFTRYLAERLDGRSALKVCEAERGMNIERNTVYVAPGDYHMVLRRAGASVSIELNQDPPENSCRPAVDPLFRSVANLYGRSALALVLTGMGQDGKEGAAAIHASGGSVIAQDQASSVVWGMPGAVVTAGLADAVLPLDGIAGEIARLVGRERSARVPVGG